MILGDPIVSLNRVEIENFIILNGNDGMFYATSISTKVLINEDLSFEVENDDIEISVITNADYIKYKREKFYLMQQKLVSNKSKYITCDDENEEDEEDKYYDLYFEEAIINGEDEALMQEIRDVV